MNPDRAKLMIAEIKRALDGLGHVAVGANSPIPAAAALLCQRRCPAMRVSILGSQADTNFTDGGRELFDCAAQGRIDAFFFSGVQIDRHGNVNLLGLGRYPDLRHRFIGNFGAPYLAGLVRNIILFRTDHSPKSLVDRVDFISAPGTHVCRLVTDKAVFAKAGPVLKLASLHPTESLESVRQATGFAIEQAAGVGTTEGLDLADERYLLDTVLPRLTALYPRFADLIGQARSIAPVTKS